MLYSLIFLLPAMLLSIPDPVKIYDDSILKDLGVSADAHVDKIYVTTENKADVYHLDCRFSRQGYPTSYFELHTTVTRQDYGRLVVGGSVPILYDPFDPRRGDVNFDDVIHRTTAGSYFSAIFSGALRIMPFILFGLVLMFLNYPKERKLLRWGSVAAARIVAEEEFQTRGGTFAKVTYVFTNARGREMRGTRSYIPTRADTREGFMIYRRLLLENPTVLFETDNSANNVLYPPYSVRLR